MSTAELKIKLIDKINLTQDHRILEEVSRLLQLENLGDLEPYKLNQAQVHAINEARDQFKKGQFLSDSEANKEIDEWLNESFGR